MPLPFELRARPSNSRRATHAQLIVLRGAGHRAFENVGQISLGVDAMQIASVEQGREDRPCLPPAALVAAKQTVLFPDADRPD